MRKEYIATGSTVDAAIDAACLLAGTSIENLDIEVLELGSSGIFGIGRREAKVKVILEVPDAPAEKKPAGAEGAFGQKLSKKERFEQKKSKQKEAFEIKPIVTAESDPELARKLAREQSGAGARLSGPPRQKDERPREERRRDDRRPQAEKKPYEERREEKPRHESNATPIEPGEMAEKITADVRAFLNPIFAKMGVEPQLSTEVREGILWLSLAGENLGLLIGRRGETLNSLQYLVNLTANKRRNDHIRVMLDVEGYRESREETLATLSHKMADKAVRTGRRVELEPMNPNDRRVVHLTLQNDSRVETSSHGEEPYRRVVISKKKTSGGNNAPNRRRPNKRRPSGSRPPQARPAAPAVEQEE